MKHRSVFGTCIAAVLGLTLHANTAASQGPSLKQALVGTWIVISWEQKKNDGTTLRQFGESPTGMAIFDASGRYIITVMCSDRANYTSNTLWLGTADENKATANGTQTYFGTYSMNEADRSIAIHIEGSSFPNWNGANQKRFVAITEDQLTLTIRPPSGETVDVVWKRAK
ncbi:lipocalin-like domain-containing protein [Bradyrhizobium monzae]|uniref:lipocalin-like domain-containing protein n=1 Tax=Bradyrhizobium sp. Oc8 TaxID=2876780 RepID=UPI001F31804D|nr:lipocalin-like domain-containing protein [Bradyrhizobium sp. Oc8]